MSIASVHQTHDRINVYPVTIISYPYAASYPILSLSYPAHQTGSKVFIKKDLGLNCILVDSVQSDLAYVFLLFNFIYSF